MTRRRITAISSTFLATLLQKRDTYSACFHEIFIDPKKARLSQVYYSTIGQHLVRPIDLIQLLGNSLSGLAFGIYLILNFNAWISNFNAWISNFNASSFRPTNEVFYFIIVLRQVLNDYYPSCTAYTHTFFDLFQDEVKS